MFKLRPPLTIRPTKFSNIWITPSPFGSIYYEDDETAFNEKEFAVVSNKLINNNLFLELEQIRKDAELNNDLIILYEYILYLGMFHLRYAKFKNFDCENCHKIILQNGHNNSNLNVKNGDLISFKSRALQEWGKKHYGIYCSSPKLKNYNLHSVYMPKKQKIINTFQLDIL